MYNQLNERFAQLDREREAIDAQFGISNPELTEQQWQEYDRMIMEIDDYADEVDALFENVESNLTEEQYDELDRIETERENLVM